MSKFKFTPWFTGLDLPTRVGIYQRIRWNEDVIFYSYWDGELWWPGDATTSLAKLKYLQYRNSGVPRWVSQFLNWRGMIRD